ncbi:glycosyltransferase [Mycetocola zhadangensis]|uniref:glycosyltransferase n=1 Tax=Mycetocola zhadangensis TaxID=1164595 RepID=UPI003A4D5BF8
MTIRDNAAPNARARPEPAPDTSQLDAEYVLPLRWSTYCAGDVFELTDCLIDLAEYLPVTVVDGSPGSVFVAHQALWGDLVRHVQPDGPSTGNGKVAGVLTGIRLARSQSVILADDDVRYNRAGLERMVAELRHADLVRPQNYFATLPWHARWDTSRSLLNRAVASDYPGTLGVNRDLVLELGGYDGDVLFENLELIRTIRAGGGCERRLDDLFVARIPPTARHFLGQRIRQAYDDFAQPPRLALELALLPMLALGIRRPWWLAGIAGASIALAEVGRRRAGGRRVYPWSSALWAPAWLLERAVCVWLAVGERMLGGARYGNSRLKKAANTPADLRRKFERRISRLARRTVRETQPGRTEEDTALVG